MIDATYVKRLATQTTLDLWPEWVHEGRSLENLIAFAKAVAREEREACAKAVEAEALECATDSEGDEAYDNAIGHAAMAIRMRSNAEIRDGFAVPLD